MGQDSRKLIQAPSESKDSKSRLHKPEPVLPPQNHDGNVESEQDSKLSRLENSSRARNNESILIEQGRLPRIVQRDGLQLVVIRDNIPVRRRRVNNTALVDGIYNLLTGGGAEKVLALRHNGHLERRQRLVVHPRRAPLSLKANRVGRILERLKPSNENVSQQKQSVRPLVSLAEAPQNAGRDELTQRGARVVDILPVIEVRLLLQKLGPVDQQAIDYGEKRKIKVISSRGIWHQCNRPSPALLTDGNVIELVELVDQRPHDGNVNTHVPQLI